MQHLAVHDAAHYAFMALPHYTGTRRMGCSRLDFVSGNPECDYRFTLALLCVRRFLMVQTTQLTDIPVGNIKEVRPETRIRDLMRLARTYGPIYQLPLPGGKRQVILSSFALVDEVCNDMLF